MPGDKGRIEFSLKKIVPRALSISGNYRYRKIRIIDRNRNEQERYRNIKKIQIARSAQQAPPIYSSIKLGIIVSGDLNMSIPCLECLSRKAYSIIIKARA